MSNQIRKLLKVGDIVYSARGGEKNGRTKIDSASFETEEDYFLYNEVRQLYYLTYYGYIKSKERTKK